MVRILFIFIFFFESVFAISSLELAQNLVSNPAKNSQLKLLFSNSSYLDKNGNLNIAQISRVLKTNSLITLNLSTPQTLKLNFRSKSDAVIFFKILSDALMDAGYVYFIPTELILHNENIDYTVEVESQYVLDPGTLYNLLKENSVYIKNVKRVGVYDYQYDLDFDNAKLNTNVNISLNSLAVLERPLKDYIFKTKDASKLVIDASDADFWFPKVLFLDKNLNLIKSVKSNEKNNHFSEFIPSGTCYVVVSDMYSLDNIRRGLRVFLKK
ncbi:hypothetical protein [Campylobacter estrildidarum]|uniref:Periplasmic protein n=1 Tax=Campylobacter estrildidarum TaxID=2510189 RepID=A0A4U7BK17_9BACT|nr:hypothetical protein [Campylobacter estrildidarum]TKX30801.1 hypothetical protein CQA69_04900 [Campylobacter estrildidarum]